MFARYDKIIVINNLLVYVYLNKNSHPSIIFETWKLLETKVV